MASVNSENILAEAASNTVRIDGSQAVEVVPKFTYPVCSVVSKRLWARAVTSHSD